MLKLKTTKKGFTIEYNGKVMFDQPHPETGLKWKPGEIKTLGDRIFQNYLDSLYKESIRGQIRDVFTQALKAPLKLGTGTTAISWDVHELSYVQLQSAIALSKTGVKSGTAVTVDFYDAQNVLHVLPLLEAESVALQVGNEFKTRLAAKQKDMVDLNAAKTVAACETIATALSSRTGMAPGAPVI